MNTNDYLDVFGEMFFNQNGNNMTNTQNQMMTNETNPNSVLYGPYEGYTKGNLFPRLYESYQNYQPATLIPRTEQEEALLNLNQMQFAMHELNLLLDVYPNDANAMKKFVEFRNNYLQQLKNYEAKYGAIMVTSDALNTTPFGWTEQTWPWDRRGA